MEANELRIGNVIGHELNENMFACTIGDIHEIQKSNGGKFHPIPLTPEILEKCGFKRINGIGDFGCFIKEDIKINIDPEISRISLRINKGKFATLGTIKYLHTLQNWIQLFTQTSLQIDF